MIFRRVLSIADFRIFQGWPPGGSESPHSFGEKTIIYGPNGSGKSTLAALFAAVSEVQRSRIPADSSVAKTKFELVDSTSDRITDAAGDSAELPPVLVFNADYVSRNLGHAFVGGHGTPLYVLGEANIELESAIADAEQQLRQLDLPALKKIVSDADRAIESHLVIVKTAVCAMLQPYDASRYNTTRFTTREARKLVEREQQSAPLTDTEIQDHQAALLRKLEDIPSDIAAPLAPDLGKLEHELRRVQGHEVTSRAISRLTENARLANWVMSGLTLHEGSGRCGFCDGQLADDRVSAIRAHFDESYRMLMSMLDLASAQVAILRREGETAREVALALASVSIGAISLMPPEEVAAVERHAVELERWLTAADSLIAARRDQPFQSISWTQQDRPDDSVWSRIRARIEGYNDALKDQRQSLASAKAAAERSLRSHVADLHGPELVRLQAEFDTADQSHRAAEKSAVEHGRLLEQLRERRRSSNDGEQLAVRLTRDLRRYFGHSQISVLFERVNDVPGIRVLRNGTTATHLSEGERNGLALLYFLRSFEDLEVEAALPRSCVVIDDPVSSLDQDALLSAFSFLLDRLTPRGRSRCAQFILLTHNFDFFRLWKRKLGSARSEDRKLASQKRCTPSELPLRRASLLEIQVRISVAEGSEVRTPLLRELTPRVDALESQYFFLFQHASQATKPDGEQLLPVAGNAARRLLESFLRFRAPHEIQFTNAAEHLGALHDVPSEVVTRVVDALHGASHRQDLDIDRDELASTTARDIAASLYFMREVDRTHFEGMCRAVQIVPDLPDFTGSGEREDVAA